MSTARSHRSSRPAARTLLGAAAAFALLAVPQAASAQRAGNLTLDPFRPAMDSRGYITVNASQVLGHKEASLGIGALSWGHGLLSFEGGDCGGEPCTYEIKDMFTATLIAAYGLKFGAVELELGASVPFVIMSGDRGPDFIGAPTPNDDERFRLEGQGIGNIGLHLKTRFLKTSKGPKIGLGLIASAYLPTVSEDERFLGESKIMPAASLILDKEFGKTKRFRAALNAGIRLRTETAEFTQNDPDTFDQPAPVTGETIKAGPEIPVGLGVAYGLSPGKFDLIGEVFGALPLSGENYMPLEAIGAIKVYLGRSSFLSLGGGRGLLPGKGGNPTTRAFIGIVFEPNIGDRDGDGYKDDVDACPDQPEDFDDFEDEDGCPEPDNDRDGILDEDDDCPLDPETKNEFQDEDGCPDGVEGDRDGDGILDNVDKCPDDPEDKDDFEDEDGCPDPDNDQDGILDVDDLCPDEAEDFDKWEDVDGCPEIDNDKDRINDTEDACPNPEEGGDITTTQETVNGKDDEDGCPDRGRVIVTDVGIEILDKVYFELDKDIIMSKSFPILDAVAATLEGTVDIQLIEIQGHTDDQGGDAYNLDLSNRRAASVRRYLIEKGIAAERLTSQGYGESQPIKPGKSAPWRTPPRPSRRRSAPSPPRSTRPDADHRRQLHQAGAVGLLRRPALPPGHQQLHDPVRLRVLQGSEQPARRHRRLAARAHRRRAPARPQAVQRAGHPVDGEHRRAQQRRRAVLHQHRPQQLPRLVQPGPESSTRCSARSPAAWTW
jgi:OOP family OmpA-OmpF porin